jgi:hypothetical protein
LIDGEAVAAVVAVAIGGAAGGHSIRVNREFDSNQIDENDLQNVKHLHPKI